VYLPSTGSTERTHTTKNNNKTRLNYLNYRAFSPSDIRGKITFLRVSFALCPRVFPTLHDTNMHYDMTPPTSRGHWLQLGGVHLVLLTTAVKVKVSLSETLNPSCSHQLLRHRRRVKCRAHVLCLRLNVPSNKVEGFLYVLKRPRRKNRALASHHTPEITQCRYLWRAPPSIVCVCVCVCDRLYSSWYERG